MFFYDFSVVFPRIHPLSCIGNADCSCFLFTYSHEYCINSVYNTHPHEFYWNCQTDFSQNNSKIYIVFENSSVIFCLFYLSHFYFFLFSLCNSLKLNNYTQIY